jgi:hypothetical protein
MPAQQRDICRGRWLVCLMEKVSSLLDHVCRRLMALFGYPSVEGRIAAHRQL